MERTEKAHQTMSKIIAELCQNHNGDRRRLGEMVLQAVENGADIVKIQSIFSTDLTRRKRFEEGRVDRTGKQVAIQRPYQLEFDRLSKLDLSYDDHLFFIDKCKELGAVPMTSIFARHRIRDVGELSWPERIVKVASYDCSSWPMITELAYYFDDFIISTGATYDEEIEKTAALVKKIGKKFAFLHCVTSYPNSLESCNISRMQWLKQFTPKVGWSDHTLVERDGIIAAKTAIMLGADYVERHFTILPADQTKDGPVSITPLLLKELSDFNKLSKEEQQEQIEKEMPDWRIMLGNPTRKMTNVELLNRDYYRGRFASPLDGEWIYNWEDKPVARAR